MDGYTVEEAASVLGVPRERVWELLARGVITGSTDLGGGMRVRLKADPPPQPSVVPLERAAEAGAGSSAELTPFRELLTEFRSLTERYGQALLALGEARGEVAGLRSRVDMLEARVDLRLPSGAAPLSSSWSATPWPIPTERVVEPPPRSAAAARSEEHATSTRHGEPGAPAAHDEERGSRRRRGRAGRRATESFADALARAEDPSIPELPGAAEAAAALAAMRHDRPSEAARAPELEAPDRDADASLPRELPSADHVLVADEAEPVPESAAASAEAAATVEQEDAGPTEVEPEPAAQAEPGPSETGSVEPVGDSFTAPPAEAAAEPEVEPEVEVEAAPEAATVAGSAADGGSETELAWDPERYSAAIEEPGWISADEVGLVPPAWSPPRASEEAPPDAAAEEAEDTGPVHAAPVAGASTPIAIESSGSRELDEGLAALDALAHPQPPAAEAAQGGPETDGGRRSGEMERAHAIGAPRPQAWVRSSSPPLATRSSASRAYRRLRRIFPS